MDDALIKVDLHLVHSVDALAWLADSPDIVPPRLVAAIDKDGVCGPVVARAAEVVPRNRDQLVDEEVEKFLVAFEACSSAHRRSDGYQFYFHYNLALHRLARLVELARGHPVYLFLPKLLLPRRMSKPEQLRWRELRATLYLPEANQAKRRLSESFLQAFGELSARMRCHRTPSELTAFLDAVLDRDLFFNVRDFADAFEGGVRSGVLFRSSALTRWQAEPALRQWLAHNRVRCIIDFRHHHELLEESARYPPELLTDIDYISLPLSGAPKPEATPRPAEAWRAYHRLFATHRENVVKAIRAISRIKDGSAAVHCHVGKDRTGWFCAVVAMLLELPEEQIEQDYLLSGQGVESAAIRQFMDAVSCDGGPAAMLRPAGLTDMDIELLKGHLLAHRGRA